MPAHRVRDLRGRGARLAADRHPDRAQAVMLTSSRRHIAEEFGLIALQILQRRRLHYFDFAFSSGAIAKRMNLASHHTLRKHEPELCRQILALHGAHREQSNERIRSALEEALRQGPPPTLKGVANRTGFPASMAWNHYPELCAEIVAKHKSHEKQAWENVGRELERVKCEEIPLPTIKALAVRLGCSIQSLRVHFPDLCHEIARRRTEQQQTSRLSRRE